MSYISKSNFLRYLDYHSACLAGVQRVKRLLKTRSVRETLTMYQDMYFEVYGLGRDTIPEPAPHGASSSTRLKYKRILDFWWLHGSSFTLGLLWNPGNTSVGSLPERIDAMIHHMSHYPMRNP